MKRKVNCIIPAYNVGRYLGEAIDSLINQTIRFYNINLVIVNDGSNDNTEEIILGYQTRYDNVFYIYQKNQGVSAARNAGLAYCEKYLQAPYTCFLDGDDKYDQNQIELLINFFEKNQSYSILNSGSSNMPFNIVFLPIRLFEKEDCLHYSYQAIDRGESRIIDLSNSSIFFSHVNSAMFETQAIYGERFDERLKISEDAQFLIKILFKTNHAGWVNNGETYYYLRKRMDESSAIDNADEMPELYQRIRLYKNEIEYYLKTYGKVPRLVQSSVLYDLHWFKSPNSTPQKHGIPFDIDQGIADIKYMIQQMDDELLEQDYIPYWYQAYFKEMKYGNFHIIHNKNEIEPKFYCGDYYFEPVAGMIQIQWIKQNDKRLVVKGFFVKPCYSNITILAKINKRAIDIKTKYSFHNDKKYFLGREIFPAMDFEFSISLSDLHASKKNKLSFYFKYQKQVITPIGIDFGWTSRFNDDNQIFIGEDVIIENDNLWNGVYIYKIKGRETIEERLLPYQDKFADGYLISRFIEYYKKYRKKRIWLFIDRPTSIGDNAEMLFRYCSRKKDGIDKYMIVPDVSYINQFVGMRNKVIIYGSFEYKFLLMFAEKVISSITLFEFTNIETNISGIDFVKMVQAFSSAQQVFLQHGITKDYGIIEKYLNSSMRDIDLLITATQKERALFLSREAGFSSSQVKLTGFPRYDGLISNPEKIITFLPTWRNRYSHDDDTYNPSFKYSDLYDSIYQFLTNEKLMTAIEKYGYRLIFKVHPKMQIQIKDFTTFENVDIICNEMSYQELYEKSSVMITDYSSAVFDFAYLKKAVIYCQTVEPEYVQDEELFSYEQDGFGKVYDNQNDAIDYLIELIKTGCQMPEDYKKRVDEFFVFRDDKNSERVYKEILKMPKRVRFSRFRWFKDRLFVKILDILDKKF